MSAAVAPVAIEAESPTQGLRVSLGPRLAALAPLLAAAVAFAVVASIVAPYPAGIFHDDGVYLILAKSLANGEGYRYLNIPGAPIATHYPPGYPFLLALLWNLAPFPHNLTIILLANALLLAVTAWALTRFVTRTLDWTPAAAAALAVAGTLSLPFLTLATVALSEICFFALLVPALMACERAVATSRTRTHDVAIGMLAGALALVRTHGIVLVGALALVLLRRREWRRALLVIAGSAVLLLPWQLWVAFNGNALPAPLRGSYGSYLGWFVDGLSQGGWRLLVGAVRLNISECAALVADRFAPRPTGMWPVISMTVAMLFFAAGAVRLARRAPVTVAFALAYFAITLAWPYASWRFVWGVWPLVLLFVVAGAESLIRWRPTARSFALVRLVPAAAAMMLAAGVARAEWSTYAARAWTSPVRDAVRTIAPAMRWIRQNTRREDVVLADAEPLMYLFTERRAIPPVAFTAAEYLTPRSRTDDAAALTQLVRQYPVRYIVTVVPSTAAAARSLSAAVPGRGFALRQAGTLPGGAVFEVLRQ